MIMQDNSGLMQALGYMSMLIYLVSSSAIMTLIFAQSVNFCSIFILSTNFPLPMYSTELLLWNRVHIFPPCGSG